MMNKLLGPIGKGNLSNTNMQSVLRAAGWPEHLIPTMAAIGQAESSGNPNAYNPRGRDNSYGLWQINMLGKLGPERRAQLGISSNEALYDPLTNARAARMLAASKGGLNNWTTYTSGDYKKYLSPLLKTGPLGSAFPQTGTRSASVTTPEEIIQGYKNVLQSNRNDQRAGLPDLNDAKRYYESIIKLEQDETDTRKQNQAEINVIDAEWNRRFFDSAEHRQMVTSTAELARKKAFIATHDTLMALVDEETKRGTEATRRRTSEIEAAEIRARQEFNSTRDALQAALDDQKNRQDNHQRYLDTLHNQGKTNRIRVAEDTQKALDVLQEEADSGWRSSMAFRLAQYQQFEAGRITAKKNAEDELASLDYQITHAKDLDPLNIKIAEKKAILEIEQADGQAKASMAANAVKLADAQIYHADRANARVMDYLAKQKSVDDLVADARINTMEAIFGVIDTGLSKITTKLGIFGNIVKELISGFARLALSKVFTGIFGGGGTASQSRGGGIGSIISSVLGGGNGIFGGGGVPGATSAVNVFDRALGGGTGGDIWANAVQRGIGAGLPAQAARVGTYTGGPIGGLAGAANLALGGAGRTGLLKSLLRGIAPTLPLLGLGTGLQLGAGLGGQSRTGRILGAIGGAGIGGALGLAAFTALGGTFTSPALVSALGILGPAALIAGPILLAGAIILKKNAARRSAEKQRDALMGDSLTQLQTLLSQVRRDKIGVDEALAQAAGIRAQYLTSSAALTDKKTRNIALKDVSRLDAIITQIKIAGVSQSRRKQLDLQLTSEFAGGGYIPGPPGAAVPIIAHANELVLNQQQQAAVGYSALSRANISQVASQKSSYGAGGWVMPRTHRQYGANNTGQTSIFIVTDKRFAEKMAVQGRDKIVHLASEDIKDQGPLYSAIRKI
jgi:hypothetical protein